MADFNSIQIAGGFPVSGVGLGGRTTHAARGEYTTTAPLSTGDRVILFDLPPRARVRAGFIKSAQLDTGAGLSFNIGTATNPTLFFNGSTVGRTAGGGVDRALAFTGTDFLTGGGRTRVILTVAAGAATGANGAIVVELNFSVEEPA